MLKYVVSALANDTRANLEPIHGPGKRGETKRSDAKIAATGYRVVFVDKIEQEFTKNPSETGQEGRRLEVDKLDKLKSRDHSICGTCAIPLQHQREGSQRHYNWYKRCFSPRCTWNKRPPWFCHPCQCFSGSNHSPPCRSNFQFDLTTLRYRFLNYADLFLGKRNLTHHYRHHGEHVIYANAVLELVLAFGIFRDDSERMPRSLTQ